MGSTYKIRKIFASWLIANHHGLQWEDGIVPYSLAQHLITSAAISTEDDDAFVYVKGSKTRMVEGYARKRREK